jgi:hypothetical protein
MIYGGVDEEKPLAVHVYDGEADRLYESVGTISYKAQAMLGQPASPVVLDLSTAGHAPELQDLPESFAMHPNFPNPFNSLTIIGYDLPEAALVRMVVYDILGRQVMTLLDGQQSAGRHRFAFDANALASGVYFYRMYVGEHLFAGKMVLLK